MASITIRKLDESVKVKLRLRAAEHGRSMEAEAREIIHEAFTRKAAAEPHPVDRIRKIVESVGGFELKIPAREPLRPPPDFSGPEYDR